MNPNQIAKVAARIGEPARTTMLMALMDGRVLMASELARAGNILPQTASRHLAGKLGVALTHHLIDRGAIILNDDSARIDARQARVLESFGIPEYACCTSDLSPLSGLERTQAR